MFQKSNPIMAVGLGTLFHYHTSLGVVTGDELVAPAANVNGMWLDWAVVTKENDTGVNYAGLVVSATDYQTTPPSNLRALADRVIALATLNDDPAHVHGPIWIEAGLGLYAVVNGEGSVRGEYRLA